MLRQLMRTILLHVFIFMTVSVFAQHFKIHENTTIIADPGISQLAEEYLSIAGQIHSLEGFRIQIFFDSGNLSKRNATQAREEFIKRFPGIEAYITFREPYYRVRIGDFRTKLEADGFRKKILQDYPHAFTVVDQIYPPPFN